MSIEVTPNNNKLPLAHETTMEKVGSTLAVMELVEHLSRGGTVAFPDLGIVLTKEDLLGPAATDTTVAPKDKPV